MYLYFTPLILYFCEYYLLFPYIFAFSIYSPPKPLSFPHSHFALHIFAPNCCLPILCLFPKPSLTHNSPTLFTPHIPHILPPYLAHSIICLLFHLHTYTHPMLFASHPFVFHILTTYLSVYNSSIIHLLHITSPHSN